MAGKKYEIEGKGHAHANTRTQHTHSIGGQSGEPWHMPYAIVISHLLSHFTVSHRSVHNTLYHSLFFPLVTYPFPFLAFIPSFSLLTSLLFPSIKLYQNCVWSYLIGFILVFRGWTEMMTKHVWSTATWLQIDRWYIQCRIWWKNRYLNFDYQTNVFILFSFAIVDEAISDLTTNQFTICNHLSNLFPYN